MNYQHIFHAGNFADVLKHSVLMLLIQILQRKETPMCYIETHAGMPIYDLLAKEPQKTLEYADGIGKLWNIKNLPTILNDYLTLIKRLQTDPSLRYYPGSPLIAHTFLRKIDRMVLTDLNPTAAHTLKNFFRRDPSVNVHTEDGYTLLNALLPPKERRGLVLIDPAYEELDELITLPSKFAKIFKKWPTGIYAIWYPIKEESLITRFHNALIKENLTPFLICELSVLPNVPTRLNGSGIAIINPPWKLKEELEKFLPTLLQHLKQHPAGRINLQLHE